MGSFCSNGTDYINETDTDLDLTPLDNTYQFVFKKEVSKSKITYREKLSLKKIANFISNTMTNLKKQKIK
jgi:hypothetical protein